MNLPESKLTKHQRKKFFKVYNGLTYNLEIRFDDECGNGHNSFAMTYNRIEKYKKDWAEGGSNPELIAEVWPEYAKYLKWHLCSTDEPLNYVANSLYHAGDKDYNGLRKGEKRQIKNGKTGTPCWELVAVNSDGAEIEVRYIEKYLDHTTKPAGKYTLEYRPWCRIGEGKEPNLEYARTRAIWPEAELEDFTEEKLLARLPDLMNEFKASMEELGFEY